MPVNHQMLLERRVFTDVSQLADRENFDEQEVIFMAGSFFQIEEICDDVPTSVKAEEKFVELKVTHVKLTLINEDDSNNPIMKDYQVLKSAKTTAGKTIRIGNLLVDRSAHSKTDSYYKALFNLPDVPLQAACLTGQAWAALKRGQLDRAETLASEALKTNDPSNKEWTITTLNCLGGVYLKQKKYPEALKYYRQAYAISKPTEEMIVNKTYDKPCIPIDKHAMYDNYQNIASINIARIYQQRGETQPAWDMYKEIVDCEMRDKTDFHCHVCMTIAEAGTQGVGITSSEYNRIWANWKSFLDLGLVDILKYRTPAVTGYLSFSHQYSMTSRRYNSEHCRTMAIDYFRKVEKQCSPYVSNREYHLYTLQCYERLAELFGYRDSRSLDYYEKMVRLCLKYHPDDLENIVKGYQGMLKMYQEQQQDRTPDHSESLKRLLWDQPDDGCSVAVELPLTPTTPEMLFANLKPLHFAFDYYDKQIDAQLRDEPDIRKKMIYCHLELAALYHNQKKTEDARRSLSEAIALCEQIGTTMSTVLRICRENQAFMRGEFDSIIQSYSNTLSRRCQNTDGCINEECYYYIAHLHEKKSDDQSTLQWLQKPMQRFEQNDYVCSHTVDCCMKLAEYYQLKVKDMPSAADTYARAVRLIQRHRSEPMATMISIVERDLIGYFTQVNNFEIIISIYQTLCEIIDNEIPDIITLYTQMKRIWRLLVAQYAAYDAILRSYDAFLDLILQSIGPLTLEMSMIVHDYRISFVNVYKRSHYLHLAIGAYQKLLVLLLQYPDDRMTIIQEYKIIAADMNKKKLLDESVDAFQRLLAVVCQHPTTGRFTENDLIHFVFYVWKNQIIPEYLNQQNFDAAIRLHERMIRFLEEYRAEINPTYEKQAFLSKMLTNYDGIADIYHSKKSDFEGVMRVYEDVIEFLTKYDIESVQERINTLFARCEQFTIDHPETTFDLYSKLLVFIRNHRLSYLPHLFTAYQKLAQLDSSFANSIADLPSTENDTSPRHAQLAERVRCYTTKALDRPIAVYRQELLPFLLEYHARDDEQVATCYLKRASVCSHDNREQALNDYKHVIELYEKQGDDFYTKCAFELNPNVCRRYAGILYRCYISLSNLYITIGDPDLGKIFEEKATSLYEQYREQFQIVVNSDGQSQIETRPFVELGF